MRRPTSRYSTRLQAPSLTCHRRAKSAAISPGPLKSADLHEFCLQSQHEGSRAGSGSWAVSLGGRPSRLLLPGKRILAAHGALLLQHLYEHHPLTIRYPQLIASSFILNHCSTPNEFPLHPYLHSFSNIRSRADLLAPCLLPDVAPSDIAGSEAEFSFAAGDFLEVYGDAPGAFRADPLKSDQGPD